MVCESMPSMCVSVVPCFCVDYTASPPPPPPPPRLCHYILFSHTVFSPFLFHHHKHKHTHTHTQTHTLSLFLSLSLFSSSYEGGPATCAYWGARNPRRTLCSGDQEPADVRGYLGDVVTQTLNRARALPSGICRASCPNMGWASENEPMCTATLKAGPSWGYTNGPSFAAYAR